MDSDGRFVTHELEALTRYVDQAGALANNPNGPALSGLGGVRFAHPNDLNEELEAIKGK